MHEAEALYRDVLINVTSFFRDPEMFEDLKRDVFPAIVNGEAGRTARPRVGAWLLDWPGGLFARDGPHRVPGYREDPAVDPESSRPISATRAFSTRLVRACIRRASRPKSAPSASSGSSSKKTRHYRIQKSVRDLCVFARQNVTVDPPFSRVDLVTCRNVLIYMSPPLQERLVPVFHFALNPGGFLVLGLAETVGSFGDLFELTNRTHKIYRRKETASRPQLTFMPDEWLAGTPAKRPGAINQPPGRFPARSGPAGAGPLRASERVGEPRLRGPAISRPDVAVPRDAERTADHQHPAHGQAGPVHGVAERPDGGQDDQWPGCPRRAACGRRQRRYRIHAARPAGAVAASRRRLPAGAVRIEGLAGVVGRFARTG